MMLRHLLPLLLIGLATADDVLELVDTDFDGKLADIETALVMFYAPWYSFYFGIIATGGIHRLPRMDFLKNSSISPCSGAATASV